MSRSGCSIEEVAEDLNENIHIALNWCMQNKMAIHSAKTKAMFISSVKKQSSIQEYQPNLKINSTPIEISKQEKLLGITKDNALNWSAQVEATIKM